MKSVKNSASFSVTQAHRGHSRFQVTGMIEWGKNKTPKNPLGFKQNPQKSLDHNLSPRKSHAEFPSHNKNFQEA